MVNGELYTFEGVELHSSTDNTRGAVRELFYLHLPDGTQIHYGRAVGFTDEESVKDVLLQIISTFQYVEIETPDTVEQEAESTPVHTEE